MGDTAPAAILSVKTVEAIFGTRARRPAALRAVSVAGDEAAIPVAGRAWFERWLAAAFIRRLLGER